MLVALLLSMMAATAHAETVVATGVGQTSAEALADAKAHALGQVASSFVSGHRAVENGEVSERIDEYVGGVLRGYDVIDVSEKEGLVTLTIRADVDAEKINTRQTVSGAEVPQTWHGELARSQDEYDRIRAMVAALDDRAQAFAVTVDRLSYDTRGPLTDIAIDYRIGWQPKWIDDVRSLAKVVGRDLEIDGGASGLLWAVAALSAAVNPALPGTLFSVARSAEKKEQGSDEPAVCFGPNAWTDVKACHEIRVPFERVTRSTRLRINARLIFDDGERVVDIGVVETARYLFRTVRGGGRVYLEQGGYRTFTNPSTVFYSEGGVIFRRVIALPTEQARLLRRVELSAL